ncbi:MAG TPA: hypothetical protein VMS12_12950, partial [Thermoanaerobaculia bacterium]|nr:hypothetical protein [Thermoanaerobaculia bacterium]
ERHVSATPRPLNEAAPDADYPASLDSVISRSIQKDREKRYQTVAEFRNALLEARKDLSESNRPLAASKGNAAVERLPAAAAVPVIPSNTIESPLSDTKADDRHRESEPAATVSTEQSASVPAVAETSSAPATKAPVVIPVPDHAPAEPVVERSGFETTTLESSAATRDVSANNTYDPLARKKFQWGLWIPLLVLGGLILWGSWVMTRPGPDEQEGTLAITATSAGVPADATEADGVTTEVSPVAQLPPNIIEGSDGLGAGDGSILREIPADPTASGGEPADLTAQPGQLTPTQAESPAVADPQFPNPQVSEREAINIIVTGVNRTNYYGVEARCLGVGSSRYVNGGYTIELIARSCPGSSRAPGALLGRWRVDGRTGDAYVQNSQGKYVSP